MEYNLIFFFDNGILNVFVVGWLEIILNIVQIVCGVKLSGGKVFNLLFENREIRSNYFDYEFVGNDWEKDGG